MKQFSKICENSSYVKVNYLNLDSELLFITENDKQVGSLILCYENNLAKIFSVEILKNHRGKGYGKKITEAAVQRCKEKSCSEIQLNTEQDNIVANSLYKQLGFIQDGYIEDFNHYVLRLY